MQPFLASVYGVLFNLAMQPHCQQRACHRHASLILAFSSQMWEGIQAVAARLKARGKAEAAAAERPRNSRRRAGAAVEDGQEEGKAMEE